jgi:hypothetical protein
LASKCHRVKLLSIFPLLFSNDNDLLAVGLFLFRSVILLLWLEFRRFVYEIEGAHLFLFDLNISVSKILQKEIDS